MRSSIIQIVKFFSMHKNVLLCFNVYIGMFQAFYPSSIHYQKRENKRASNFNQQR